MQQRLDGPLKLDNYKLLSHPRLANIVHLVVFATCFATSLDLFSATIRFSLFLSFSSSYNSYPSLGDLNIGSGLSPYPMIKMSGLGSIIVNKESDLSFTSKKSSTLQLNTALGKTTNGPYAFRPVFNVKPLRLKASIITY